MTTTSNPADAINAMLSDRDDPNPDLTSAIMRDLLICSDLAAFDAASFTEYYDAESDDDANAIADRIRPLLDEMRDNYRDAFSMLCLDFSLCPMHTIDYAICFDDETPDCAAIRACFPSHDT